MTRASMLAVLASDFVRTARASGLAPYTVDRHLRLPQRHDPGGDDARHGVLVPRSAPTCWSKRCSLGQVSVRSPVEALIASDFAPLQGFVLTMAIMYVALNLIIDILYGLIDPRVRLES